MMKIKGISGTGGKDEKNGQAKKHKMDEKDGHNDKQVEKTEKVVSEPSDDIAHYGENDGKRKDAEVGVSILLWDPPTL